MKSPNSPNNQAGAEISQLLGFAFFPMIEHIYHFIGCTTHHDQKPTRSTPSTTSEPFYCGGSLIDSIGWWRDSQIRGDLLNKNRWAISKGCGSLVSLSGSHKAEIAKSGRSACELSLCNLPLNPIRCRAPHSSCH